MSALNSQSRALHDLSREALYERIWSTPSVKLAEEFGLSDVAVAKRCKRLNVPRPPRGYWAKLAAGKKQNKAPLPPEEEVIESGRNRPFSERIALSSETDPWHDLAKLLLDVINSKRQGDDRRVHVKEPLLPEVKVTKSQARRTAQAFDALIKDVESRGIPYRKARSKYDAGYFEKAFSRLTVTIEEELGDEADNQDRGKYSHRSWHEKPKPPSGRLCFSLSTSTSHGMSQFLDLWAEGEDAPIEELLANVVRCICEHYLKQEQKQREDAIRAEADRIENEKRRKEKEEADALLEQKEAQARHEKRVVATARHREDDLLKAAQWWRMYRDTVAFIDACEAQWRAAQSDTLQSDQAEWLEWGRKTARTMSPFNDGYPEPAKDGAFDAGAVPFGGPYPQVRKFPKPPTLPEIPPPAPPPENGWSSSGGTKESKPYPFWLKYQKP